MRIYEKSVRELMRDMVTALVVRADDSFTKQQATDWFKTNYPKIKRSTITAPRIAVNQLAKSHLPHNSRWTG